MSYPEAAWSGAQRVWCMKGSGKYQVETQMKNWGEGARAVVHVNWTSDSGHVFCAEVKDGKIIYVDPQTGSSDCSSYFKRAMKGATYVFRVDNLLPADAIKDCCGNIGGIL
ncbi:MAG: hypothetical protein LUF33_00175 [Clostridiales bacterium]|nr:hypothetical protein [Clostridiales bacterium]